jgi:hypothetical protein
MKGVGEPCAGEPHARFDAAVGGVEGQSAKPRGLPTPPTDPSVEASQHPPDRQSRQHLTAIASVARYARVQLLFKT